MEKDAFFNRYPVPLNSLILTPILMREYVLKSEYLPSPGLKHIDDICQFGGYSYSAIHTALSRMKKSKSIEEFHDSDGNKRYSLGQFNRNIGEMAQDSYKDAKGFSLAIFSFKTHEETKRKKARKLFQDFAFRYFTKNTYIRKTIPKEPFMENLKAVNLENNVFLFQCEDPNTEYFKKKLFKQLDMQEAVQQVIQYKKDMESFLSPDIDRKEFAQRLFYNGPVFHRICFDEEPPIPESYYPPEYPMKELKKKYSSLSKEHLKDAINYYMSIEENYHVK